MPPPEPNRLEAVQNMLFACAGARSGQKLLILREDPSHGYYGPGLDVAIAHAAETLGLSVTIRDVPIHREVDALPPDLEQAFRDADHALFLARLGDQIRFLASPDGARPIVSYILDTTMLSSPFATAPHAAFVALKAAFDDVFAGARHIRVTCPLGTEFEGQVPGGSARPKLDVTVKRFPMSVFAPIDARPFEGRVAVAHFLVGTGSRYYDPYGVPLLRPVFAEIAQGRIAGWTGPASEVERVREHYTFVAKRFGIDQDAVHSWHAGIHPACAFQQPAEVHFERWSGGAFGNPRLLHFHTCGAYAPGEICWNIVDPTIEVDGRAMWKSGRIDLDVLPGASRIIAEHPEIAGLFASPARDIGIQT